MATNEQIEMLLSKMKKAPPSECFHDYDMNTVGVRAILKLLNETDDKVTAGRISECMHVSTARVAVLLKKMVAKGLIERESDSTDGRVVVVKLSEYGKQTADRLRSNLYVHIGELIDSIGMDRLLEYVEISNEIHRVMSTSHREHQEIDV